MSRLLSHLNKTIHCPIRKCIICLCMIVYSTRPHTAKDAQVVINGLPCYITVPPEGWCENWLSDVSTNTWWHYTRPCTSAAYAWLIGNIREMSKLTAPSSRHPRGMTLFLFIKDVGWLSQGSCVATWMLLLMLSIYSALPVPPPPQPPL